MTSTPHLSPAVTPAAVRLRTRYTIRMTVATRHASSAAPPMFPSR